MPRKKRKRGFPRSHLTALRDSQRGERLARKTRKRKRQKATFDPHALLATMIDRVSALGLESPEGDEVSVVSGKSTFGVRDASPVYNLTPKLLAIRERLNLSKLPRAYWHDYTVMLDLPIEKSEFTRVFEAIRPVMSRYYRRRAYLSILSEVPSFERGAVKSSAERWRSIAKKSATGSDTFGLAFSQLEKALAKLQTKAERYLQEGRGFTVSAIAPRTWRP